ncbi:Bilirubin oxidase [Fulvia fulva]|uniref:Bilirubin oxidase n=1 Tax=Passalora fulva TaxID=5499 RepID=A0A9Q8L532_PASFU|nr:Bilirubin oxidase [Fulvia fulva]KAK4634969.1 Bilirubin oxidase [Fulvia fulva]KAK4637104.1 Bilirubin oxidase [Fulvia fulva]UJO10884.1 Bilirubin oxidase [Fulvia fulva]WPV08822.1 Bilirubin oxidase [Fulvia fulva]WPV23774.1 Bilirubin oxidase [Fulvia fulva]
MSFFTGLLAFGLAASSSFAEATPQIRGPRAGRPGSRPGSGGWRGNGKSAGSPEYKWIFENPLPIPEIAQPAFTETINGRQVQYYESEIKPFEQQVYPNLGTAKLIGYDGVAPGKTYCVPRGTETVIRYTNRGTQSSSVHLHGSYTHSAWDGWAFDELQPGQWKDYYYPNTETARPMWYHDHAHGHTAADAYYGQAGVYIITDPAEDALGLPSGKYDVPLCITDKIYQANGDLASPTNNPINFFGDTIEVNSQPWPYLNVEPRKYRFRLFDMSLSRSYDIYIADENNNPIQFQVIGSDSGLFAAPVDAKDVVISMGERYEIIIDFSCFAGQNITMFNGQQIAQINEFHNTDKVMRFVVGDSVTDESNNNVPSTLNGAIDWPAQRDTIDKTFNFQMGGADVWTVNGVDFSDPNSRVLARPPQGTVERWRLVHTGGPAVHPVHIHLVNMQVLSRTGGARGLMPYEAAGLKDVVMLAPGEIVDVLAFYGPWNGLYMFHCHNLVHEDHTMMAAFNTTTLEALGYDFNSTQGFGDPMDPRFIAKAYDESAFSDAAKHEAVSSLAALNAYAPVSSLMAAEKQYYATAGLNSDAASAPAQTAAPTSVGVGFVANAVPTSTALFPSLAQPFRA